MQVTLDRRILLFHLSSTEASKTEVHFCGVEIWEYNNNLSLKPCDKKTDSAHSAPFLSIKAVRACRDDWQQILKSLRIFNLESPGKKLPLRQDIIYDSMTQGGKKQAEFWKINWP